MFWKYKSDNVDDMPQPIIQHFTDEIPVFYLLPESKVLATAKESDTPYDYKLDDDQRSQKKYNEDDSTEMGGKGGVTLQ